MTKVKDKDMRSILENCTIMVDSREKLPNHLTKYFDENSVNYKVEKLDYGDYGIIINPNNILGNEEEIKIKVAIERKMNLDEIATNLTGGKDRFKREMQRCVDDEGFMIIMIENNTYSDLMNKNYRSQLTPKQFLALLHSILAEFKVPFVFKTREESPLYVYNILKYCTREYIKNKIKN